ncbi:MAG: DUF2071 domain-containing protein [bacterium]|nr:DUF2071 domain-containing protein [bacterium]
MISANYVVDPEFIRKYIPKGTELELFEGKCYVSLVAFLYSNTKLMKIPVPFHQTFEEINLRLYVKRRIGENEWRSEVAFPKLFFPKRAVSFVANTIYKENYETRKMNHSWSEDSLYLHTSYGIKKGGWHQISVVTEKKCKPIATNTPEHLFSKHYWGTAQVNDQKCTVYEVDRSDWKIYKTVDSEITFDFGTVFGADFHLLTNIEPESVQLFDGSPVTVYKKSILK